MLEFASGDSSQERDKTPITGKFWVYEQAIRVPFYGIYEVNKVGVQVYQLLRSEYQLIPTNERGHYPIEPMGVELGIWQERYQNLELPWLRWWDNQGNLLQTGWERCLRRATPTQQQKHERNAWLLN